MVLVHLKKGDESQFLYETSVKTLTEDLIEQLTTIYNGRLKIQRICDEMSELAKHGIYLPPNMIGLTDEQRLELKLKDDWAEECSPSGGYELNPDPLGRRSGRMPNTNMANIILDNITLVKDKISKKQVESGVCLTMASIQENLDLLFGAVSIVYPMGLPPHDPIQMEFNEKQDLTGTQASLHVLKLEEVEVWFCGKLIQVGKKLGDFIGMNEKSKVILKIQKRGQGPPGREPLMSEEDQKKLMLQAYKRQEELKKLEEGAGDGGEVDDYLNSNWADNEALKRSLQGINNITQFRPK